MHHFPWHLYFKTPAAPTQAEKQVHGESCSLILWFISLLQLLLPVSCVVSGDSCVCHKNSSSGVGCSESWFGLVLPPAWILCNSIMLVSGESKKALNSLYTEHSCKLSFLPPLCVSPDHMGQSNNNTCIWKQVFKIRCFTYFVKF